ncbi:sulfotransferase [Mesorhizobium sp. M1060]|uniref:tetratricopeptide repeat-containing sulfotransferase family protein n=1 Tax=unclassified Mesorhizobium TaxID=325217 RepID=UPI0003D01B06|nr:MULTISPECIES: sulfotransferase [unclassified Mesorhizobium]ESZ05576.1 sulfotransferase [Mesorhizobium sp. L2C089B000]WJI51303.1 sulfotransferase [Mesorhizobium sp. C089B]
MNTRLPPVWSKHLKSRSASKVEAPKAKPLSRAQVDDVLLKQALELQQANRLFEAEELCHRVLARTPNHPLSLYILGTLGLGFDDELAIRYLARAVGEAPLNPYFHICLGETYLKVGEHEHAIKHLQRACELKPNLVEALCGLGRAYVLFDKADMALPLYEKALKVNGSHPLVRTSLARALIGLGRMDEAAVYLKEAIERRLDMPGAYRDLVYTRKFTDEPPELGSILSEIANPKFTADSAQPLHHAAGKVLDDLQRYEEAMEHFQKAKRGTGNDFDIESYRRRVDSIIDFFTPEMLTAKAGYGNPSEVPVFVLGMPRSGTTLTEQICSSHPDVHGAGELTKLRRVANAIGYATRSAGAAQGSVPSITADLSRTLAEEHLSYLRQRAPGALRIVDKRPHNFELIGLIGILFPNARIIHCRRDAIDNCLSCFISNLNKEHRYTSDLEGLGLYYREYDRLMHHWKTVFPRRIFENRYEDLISDQEGQSRKLIDHLGLTWDDACLRFFAKGGSVRTASRWQVRQPIYKSSVKRWKNYEGKIQPLIDALGDLAET